jgi:hypothetical protein
LFYFFTILKRARNLSSVLQLTERLLKKIFFTNNKKQIIVNKKTQFRYSLSLSLFRFLSNQECLDKSLFSFLPREILYFFFLICDKAFKTDLELVTNFFDYKKHQIFCFGDSSYYSNIFKKNKESNENKL